jgi:hypothetical protein
MDSKGFTLPGAALRKYQPAILDNQAFLSTIPLGEVAAGGGSVF